MSGLVGKNVLLKRVPWLARRASVDPTEPLNRSQWSILIFFHGYSLAHTIRPLVAARALRERGYRVVCAGVGPHAQRIRGEGFRVHEVVTLSQSRMDEYVTRRDYACYDLDWIERCVQSERKLIRTLRPDLLLADMKPTVWIAAQLEGVDLALVEQGYAYPGYPFPIPLVLGFCPYPGPLADYLWQRDTDLKRINILHLLADIPEFHPPGSVKAEGYHYVGSLLDDPVEERKVPLLADNGWDTSLPLLYVTCGSTGASPDWLGPLLEQARHEPYRLLVTTAGRWTGYSPSPNIRLTEFLPGEWILKRAKLLIGIGGIGSIYQALRQGVPIIGSPEHLDQEYHLNSVERLGLGVKLDRQEFTPGRIFEAVRSILDHYAEFQARCQTFSVHLKSWQGGKAAADVIDMYFQERAQPIPLHLGTAMGEREFLHYLFRMIPPELSQALAPDRLLHIVSEGCKGGLPVVRQNGQLVFDRLIAWNWLSDHHPTFFQTGYRALAERRESFMVHDPIVDRVRCRQPEQDYRITVRVHLLPTGGQTPQQLLLFLPYPIPTPSQTAIHLLSCTPEALREYLVPTFGFFYGYPVPLDTRSDGWSGEYTVAVTIRERCSQHRDSSLALSAHDHRRYLEAPAELSTSQRVTLFREHALSGVGASASQKARALYEAFVRTKRYKKTFDRCQCLTCSTQAILSDDGGHCLTLARTFITLCRLEGIPAREVTGALLGYPLPERPSHQRMYREYGLWAHTWAEIFLEETGWLPVEFNGITIGEQVLTDQNVTDPQLREQIVAATEPYLNYFFGNLDCQHLVFSNSVKTIPPFLVATEQGKTPTPWQAWQPAADLPFECELLCECV